MCKNPEAIIADAKRDAGRVFALYKGDELEGLCLVHNEALAIAYGITSDDELDYFAKSSTRNVTNPFEFVRRLFGVDKGFERGMYTVAAC